MKRLLLALILLLPLGASAQFNGCSAGFCAPKVASSGGSYTGTGDVVSGWVNWYGLYAFSSATRGNNAIELCDAATAGNCTIMVSSATTGLLALTLVNGVTNCATSTCYAAIWYDQSGASNCSGACNYTFTTRPIFVASCTSSGGPCLEAQAGSNSGPTISSTKAQPFSATTVLKAIGTGSRQCAFGESTGNIRMGGSATTGDNYIFAGTAVEIATASDSAFHAFSALFSGASSKISIDGGSTTVAATPGTNAWQNGQVISVFGCGDAVTTNKMFIIEAGTNSTDISGNFSALSTAQTSNAQLP